MLMVVHRHEHHCDSNRHGHASSTFKKPLTTLKKLRQYICYLPFHLTSKTHSQALMLILDKTVCALMFASYTASRQF